MSKAGELALDRQPKRRLKKQSAASSQRIDPNEIDGDALKDLVIVALAVDAAIRIGATRDGGAWCIAVYLDGEVSRAYAGATEDVNECLRDIVAELQDPREG